MLEEDALATADVKDLRDMISWDPDAISSSLRGGPTDVTRSRLRISKAQERRCS